MFYYLILWGFLDEFVVMFNRKFEQAVSAMQAEFLGNVFAVMFDRANADEQFVGNLPAGHILAYQNKYAFFTSRQIDNGGCVLRK